MQGWNDVPDMSARADVKADSSPAARAGRSGAADPDSMTPAERREHSRQHSNIHARNLSAFFPRPGTEAEAEYDSTALQRTDAKPAPLATISEQQGGATLAPSAARRNARNVRRQSYLMTDAAGNTTIETRMPSAVPNAAQNLLSPEFMSTPSDGRSPSASWTALPSRAVSDTYVWPDAVPEEPARTRSPTAARPAVALPKGSAMPIPHSARPLIPFCVLHFVLGSALWVLGAVRDSLALVGFGYLVVFDTFGLLSTLATLTFDAAWTQHVDAARMAQLGHERDGLGEVPQPTDLRRPYGTRRIETLLFFSEMVYLLFAGMYMCKENVEHALLAANLPHTEDREGVVLPFWVLLGSLAACVFTNVGLRNHGNLAAACGIGARPRAAEHGRHKSVLSAPAIPAGALQDAMLNPFSVTVLFFGAVLLAAAMFLPPEQVAALDKVAAGLESAAMLYVATTAVAPLSMVLLQGSPPQALQRQLHRAIGQVETHPAVQRIKGVQVWQLSPPTLAYSRTATSEGLLDSAVIRQGPKSASLVATIQVLLKEKATAEDCTEVTRFVWQRCAPAIGASPRVRAGEPMRGGQVAGELTVQVLREGHEIEHEHGHGHGHEHEHGHGHGHGHEHGHKHGHCGHHHGHDHDHGHDHGHDHDHGHHDHKHDHGPVCISTHDHEHDHHHHNHAHAHAHAHTNAHAHGHDYAHDHTNGHAYGHAYVHAHAHGHAHADDHAHDHANDHDFTYGSYSPNPYVPST